MVLGLQGVTPKLGQISGEIDLIHVSVKQAPIRSHCIQCPFFQLAFLWA